MTEEVAWFTEPPPAKLARGGCEDGDVIHGWLHFIDPQGSRAAVPVTLGAQTELSPSEGPSTPIWHIEFQGEFAIVSPSVHYIGFWHSPNPVMFRLVEQLGDEQGIT